MQTKKIALVVLALVTLVSCQVMKTGKDQQTISARLPSAAESRLKTQGPIDDCLNFAALYARNEGLTSECTLNYEHYFSQQDVAPISKKNIRIGSFNVFHLGDNQASLKNFTLIAKIMNQWDIVGAQELMPLPGPQAVSNQAIFNLLAQTGANNDYVKKNLQVERPGYLNLLTELRRLDPSWALIIQSEAEGEGGAGEMAGFYYRQSVVQLREWNYCPAEKAADLRSQKPIRNYACLVKVPEYQQKLISRRAFAAYFQSGQFDFIGLTAHVRFRPADGAHALKAQAQELCINHAYPNRCKPTKDNVGRYYEVKAMADQIETIQQLANDKDVIYMGDFNLELFSTTIPYWNSALKSAEGFKVFQSAPTTLGVKKGALVSNYDHFIFNPQITTACSPKTARSFDFTAKSKPPTELQNLFAEAAQPAQVEKQIQLRLQEIRSIAKAKFKRDKVTVTNLDPKEIEEYKERFKGATQKIALNHVGAMLELISDHIPVEMECLTTGEKFD